ncbi:hypothetical protein Oweho_3386 [Owenweeksia hongkongensis DSM 17368]|uniref:Uncharacterized protein n=1 Tax=Owenweeksia hongkongensis (strain DSM 17368 / CIP 108786 / JCM 12287 / NRRL B-23963 / UST20020801) TaxID=926562 RepID=G8R5M0_OWEHD|nr:hypothetical protein [Owenweeksia hongkongensis]AEV34336.1 hypothetical protein Oweho_3386 [Owenweeksia hongkongensis DSM 17368]
MKIVILLVFLSSNALAQIHLNSPLPEILEDNVKVIDEDIIGWSISLDGQWLSEDMVIPLRGVSQNEQVHVGEKNSLGLDNIYKLLLFPTIFGQDTLCTLVKLSESGFYEYSATEQKWTSTQMAYYYVFDAKELRKLIDEANTDHTTKITLRDYGSIEDIKSKKIANYLRQNMVIKPKTDQLLVIHIRFDAANKDKIYFQISSQHNVFTEVEGITKDLTLNGKSLYRSHKLLSYIHYEYDKEAFLNFFNLD